MLPSIFISCVPIVGQGTIALGTSAFGKGVGTFTLGASTGGSSYHEALVSGHSNGKAIMMVCCLVLVKHYFKDF